MEPTDAELVRACTRGDDQAWETLVRRYRRLVYSIPRRSGLDEDAAAEVFQHVFVTLVEHLDTLEQPERLSAWLVTSAKRETWRVSRRAAANRAVRAPEDEAVDLVDGDTLAEDEMVRMEEQATLRRAVDSLDCRCRQMVELLFYADEPFTYGEIATRMGLAEGSVGPVRGRCLERLRRQLAATAGQTLVSLSEA
jgi:RNA polymerase sigma factor (sigma-70 family)